MSPLFVEIEKMSVSENDWKQVSSKSSRGESLTEYFKQLPFEQWDALNDPNGLTFLHYTSRFGNVDALKLLLSRKPEIRVTQDGSTPLHVACEYHNNVSTIEVLCAYNTSMLSTRSNCGYRPIDVILSFTEDRLCRSSDYDFDQIKLGHATLKLDGVHVLIANGVRLKSTRHQEHITQAMRDFEQGVLRCRNVVVILLGLKKRRSILNKLDRFLVQQELAVAIWSTRYDADEEWQW